MKRAYITYTPYAHWGLHDLISDLGEYLKSNHQYTIEPSTLGSHCYFQKFNYHLPDCEILLYDDELDCLKAISFSEAKTPLFDILAKRNNKNDLLILLHHWSWGIADVNKLNYNFRIKNASFYTFRSKTNFDHFYNKRQSLKYDSLIDKLFFRASTGRGDQTALSELGITNSLFPSLPYEEYLDLAIQYKIGLSIGCRYEIAHRDIEYMAIGLPMLRLEYLCNYFPKIIPNYHYISIDRNEAGVSFDMNLDNNGGKKYIDAYVKRFNQVKDDHDFLDFISYNANKYYKDYCAPGAGLKHMLNHLEIE